MPTLDKYHRCIASSTYKELFLYSCHKFINVSSLLLLFFLHVIGTSTILVGLCNFHLPTYGLMLLVQPKFRLLSFFPMTAWVASISFLQPFFWYRVSSDNNYKGVVPLCDDPFWRHCGNCFDDPCIFLETALASWCFFLEIVPVALFFLMTYLMA